MRFAYKTPRFVYPLFFHHINNKKINVKFFLSFLHSVAHTQFSRLVYGKLGKLQIPLPSCVYHAIQTQFKSERTFAGFKEHSSDSD